MSGVREESRASLLFETGKTARCISIVYRSFRISRIRAVGMMVNLCAWHLRRSCTTFTVSCAYNSRIKEWIDITPVKGYQSERLSICSEKWGFEIEMAPRNVILHVNARLFRDWLDDFLRHTWTKCLLLIVSLSTTCWHYIKIEQVSHWEICSLKWRNVYRYCCWFNIQLYFL